MLLSDTACFQGRDFDDVQVGHQPSADGTMKKLQQNIVSMHWKEADCSWLQSLVFAMMHPQVKKRADVDTLLAMF